MVDLIVGKTYNVIEVDDGYINIVDESGESYWYPIEYFSVTAKFIGE